MSTMTASLAANISTAPNCPCCTSPVVTQRFNAGSIVRWCRRCSWSRIEEPDGSVAKETVSLDPDDMASI